MDLTLNALIGTLQECGCCPPPECCPPLVECQEIFGAIGFAGFLKPPESESDSSLLEPGLYKKRTRVVSISGGYTVDGTYNIGAGDVTYAAFVSSITYNSTRVEEVESPLAGGLYGRFIPDPCGVEVGGWKDVVCTFAGSWVETNQSVAFTGTFPDYDVHVFTSLQRTTTYSSAEGDETEAHAAWRTGGMEGPEPVELYGPCVLKITESVSAWYYGEGGVTAEESTGFPDYIPYPITTVTYDDSLGVPSVPGGSDGVDVIDEFVYADLVTWADFITLAHGWMEGNINFRATPEMAGSESASDVCEYGPGCHPYTAIGSFYSEYTGYPTYPDYAGFPALLPSGTSYLFVLRGFVRFRFKLNKCCPWRNIHSEWDQVFYPREWLDWFSYQTRKGESDPDLPEPAPAPEKALKAWSWSGTPPLCSEDSDSTTPPVDPYDHEPMWSPWSLVMSSRDDGVIANRNYQQKCYEAPVQEFPTLFGTYTGSESV